jgi:hypothetical protein
VEGVGSIVCACVSCDRGCWNRLQRARRLEKVLTVGEVGSSAVSCVTWDRGDSNLLRRVQKREKILSVGAIVSSVAVCVACVVVTATVAPERKLGMS